MAGEEVGADGEIKNLPRQNHINWFYWIASYSLSYHRQVQRRREGRLAEALAPVQITEK